jgi:hypothetical protein
VLFICASLVAALLAVGPPGRAPLLELDHDAHCAAPALLGITAAPPPATHRPLSSFRVSRDIELAVSSVMKSVGGAAYYRLAPGLALGAGGAVATLEVPSGRLRALQLLTLLRFKF